MKQITCNFCGDSYPNFDVAHVCSKGPYAPRLKPNMNERIKQLAEQATLTWVEEVPGGVQDMEFFDREKFAELIVQECIEINKQELSFNAFERLMNKYKEHFGVESTSIKVGSRVKVVSGFNVGAKGTVSYIEPTGRMWVMRDGASTDVFYTPDEVVRIEQ